VTETQKPQAKKIDAAKTMKKIMADHFLSVDAATRDPARKVAWCTSVGPAELLQGFGFEVYYPENHAAMLGATRKSTDYIPYANAQGYSPEICSYLTADVGAYLQGYTPLTEAYGIQSIPKPDVLVYNTNQCRDVQDWFMWYSKKWNVPCVGLHTHRNVGAVTTDHVDSLTAQIKSLAGKLEEIAGAKLDMDRFRESVRLSRKCSELWEKVLRTGTARPGRVTPPDTNPERGGRSRRRRRFVSLSQRATDIAADASGRSGFVPDMHGTGGRRADGPNLRRFQCSKSAATLSLARSPARTVASWA